MSRDAFLDFLNELLNSGWYAPPKRCYMKKDVFCQLSYKRWALVELKNYVIKQPAFMRPVDIVEKFRKKMNEFSCSDKPGDAKIVFSVAYDVSTDILDMLL